MQLCCARKEGARRTQAVAVPTAGACTHRRAYIIPVDRSPFLASVLLEAQLYAPVLSCSGINIRSETNPELMDYFLALQLMPYSCSRAQHLRWKTKLWVCGEWCPWPMMARRHSRAWQSHHCQPSESSFKGQRQWQVSAPTVFQAAWWDLKLLWMMLSTCVTFFTHRRDLPILTPLFLPVRWGLG